MIKITYKRVCDRCGKDIGGKMQNNDNELHFTKQRNTRFGYDKLMHLCDDCLLKFDRFMSSGN